MIHRDVDENVISGGDANGVLENTILAQLMAADSELTYPIGGEQQQQLESLDALYRGLVLAMLVIFASLAIPLRSYVGPFIVMAIIPFGVVGVVLGHLVLGVAVSVASLMGFFGLSGVVVNDSLVMLDFIDQRIRERAPLKTVIIDGAKQRFRPSSLTSVTTFLAFTPLVLEPSIQAQSLVRFAASFGVGIVITTASCRR
ncbi:MAG: efflux RND transporter permease subunit [Rhodospirillaceae bacterium]|nr:efflux RND transporter permease subunit [Rhodospirillaceae bacterium]